MGSSINTLPEVSTRAVGAAFSALRRRDIAIAPLLDGLSITEADGDDPFGRVPWNDVALLLDRMDEAIGDPLEMEEASAEAIVTQRALQVLASFVVGPRELYDLCVMVSRSVYRVFGTRLDELPDGRLRMELALPERYRGSIGIMRATNGTLRRYPSLIGLQDARVEAMITPRRGVFLISPPPHDPLPARLLRRVQAPVAALLRRGQEVPDLTAEELASAIDMGFGERACADIAQELGLELIACESLDAMSARLTVALEELLCIRALRLWARLHPDGALREVARMGDARNSADSCFSMPLTLAGDMLGRLELDLSGEPLDSTMQQLGAMTPWLTAAIHAHVSRSPAGLRRDRQPAALPTHLSNVAELLVEGHGEKEVASRLGLTLSTTRTYVKRLYRRLGVSNRAELVGAMLVARHGRTAAAEPSPDPIDKSTS